jgi:hypothetical protein
MTRQGGRTNANRAHHSHSPHNHLGPTTLALSGGIAADVGDLRTYGPVERAKLARCGLFMNEPTSCLTSLAF